MRRARLLLASLLALGVVASPVAPSSPAPIRPIGAVEVVAAERIQAVVPRGWKHRPIPWGVDSFRGIHAARNLHRFSADGAPGLEAYWVDATRVKVPSDYYVLAVGPAMDRLPGKGCRRPRRATEVALPSETGYVAMATGVCTRDGKKTRWGSFVAAPGFGPVRKMGIAESGLYSVFVAVPDGRRAARRMEQLLTSVSFDGTPVRDLLTAARATSGWRARTEA